MFDCEGLSTDLYDPLARSVDKDGNCASQKYADMLHFEIGTVENWTECFEECDHTNCSAF